MSDTHQTRRARLFAWLIGMTLPHDFRVRYWGFIRSSYTAAELRPILERSRREGGRTEEDVMDLAIVKGGRAYEACCRR